MARVGGRITWFAWFAGLISLGAVAGMLWLAMPMAPVITDWAGSALRGDLMPQPAEPVATSPEPEPEREPLPDAVTAAGAAPEQATIPSRCEDLYPPGLWGRLTADRAYKLDEGVRSAPSTVAALSEILDAQTLIGCAFTRDGGRSVLTLAAVPDTAAAEAGRVLSENAFACRADGGGVRCERAATDDTDAEVHIVRGGLWLASIRSYPGPPAELSSTLALVWP